MLQQPIHLDSSAIRPDTFVASMMLVNTEIGAIQVSAASGKRLPQAA